MSNEKLKLLEELQYQPPIESWQERKTKIYEKLHEIVEIFEKNVDDQDFIKTLKEMETKFK